jgi:hypothetical protein
VSKKYREAVQKDQTKKQAMGFKLQEEFGEDIQRTLQLRRAEIENNLMNEEEEEGTGAGEEERGPMGSGDDEIVTVIADS